MELFSDAEMAQLKEITELYMITKDLILYSEELNNLESFMPPINEIKDAYDHIMRVTAVKFSLNDRQDGEYVKRNLEKVFSHIYRATFELFDYIRIYQKDAIDKKLSDVSKDAFVDVFPDYYRTIKPRLEELINQIPIYKKDKDIGDPNLTVVKKYHAAIMEIRGYIQMIDSLKSSLVEYDVKRRDEQLKSNWTTFILLVVSAAIGGLIVYFLTR
jgi:hypothetical protein